MELNIKWTEIREVMVLPEQLYFVAEASKKDVILYFCIAYKAPTGTWKVTSNFVVPFEVTHASIISGLHHEIFAPANAIGDKVVISPSINEYKAGSIGEIVGKYNKSRTWCIRMEDNFVILLEDKWFKRYSPGGE